MRLFSITSFLIFNFREIRKSRVFSSFLMIIKLEIKYTRFYREVHFTKKCTFFKFDKFERNLKCLLFIKIV